MKRSNFGIPVVAAAALAVVGATPTGHTEVLGFDSPEVTPQPVPTTVTINNHNSLNVEVVAVTESGRRFRLGSVRRGAERTFDLPDCVCEGTGLFRLKIYTVGRKLGPSWLEYPLEAVKTRPISPATGGDLVLQVQSPLSDSFIDHGP